MGIVNKEGALYMATGVDNTGLYAGLDDAENRINDFEGYVKKAGIAMGSLFAITGTKDFITQMVKVRGEFQQMDVAIETLLGSKEKADELMAQVKEYAKISPLEMKDVSSATQMMLGFNIEAEKVPRYLKAIGDVSMGDSQRFNSLTLAFSQMSATGKLMGQDLNQMINAGFNPLSVIAEKTGKSISVLKEEMAQGAISAEMIQQSFIDATSAGGKFYQMSENASKTINGQLSMLQDSMDSVFNELGTKSESVIISSIQSVTTLVENYEKMGKVISGLITTYGSYRAAVALTISLEKGWTVAQMANYKWLLMIEKAQKLLNATMLANPYVLITTAVVGLVAAMWALHDSTTAAEKAQKKFADKNQEMVDASEKRKESAKELIGVIQDESQAETDRLKAYYNLIKLYPALFKDIDIEKVKIAELTGLVKSLNEEESKRYGKDKQNQLSNLYAQRSRLNKDIESLGQSPNGNRLIRKKEAEEELKIINTQIEALEKEKKSFIELQNQANKPKEFINIDDEVKKTEEQISTLKKQISDIRSGKEKAEAGKAIKDVIAEKMKELKAQEDALEVLTGSDKSAKKTAIDKNRLKAETADRLQQIEELKKQLINQQHEQERELIQDRLNLMEDGTEKTLAQINLDHQKRESEIIRKGDELVKQQQEIERKIWEAANPDWKDKGMVFTPTTTSVSQLPEDIQKQLAEFFYANNQAEEKAAEDLLKSMLMKYQGYAKQRLELEKQFNKDVAYLESQRDGVNDGQIDAAIDQAKKLYKEGLSSINMEEFKDEIDWSIVFGELDKVSTDALYSLRDKLKKYVSEIGASLTPEDMKEVMDAIKNLDDQIAGRNPFGELSDGAKSYRGSVEEVSKAQAKLNALMDSGKKGTKEYKKAEQELSDAQMKRQESLSKMTLAVNEMGAKGSELVNAGQDIVNILSTLGVSVPESISGMLNGLGEVVSGLESIDLTKPFSIISASTGILSGLVSSVAGLFGGGNNDDKLFKQIEQDKNIVGLYDKLINKQKEYLSTLTGSDAQRQADEIEKMIGRQLTAQQNALEKWFNTGKSWNHHSMGYRLMRDLGGELGLSQLEDMFDWDVSKWTGLQENIDLWERLPEEVRAYGEAVVGAKEETEDLAKSLQETFVGVSYDSFRDGFLDALMDMDSSVEDFADNVEKYLQRAILESLMVDKFDSKIRSLYDRFSESNSDGNIDKGEYDELMRMRDQMAKDMVAERDALKEVFNWNTNADNVASDNSLKGAYSKASQESIDLLAGQTGAVRVILDKMLTTMGGMGMIDQSQFLSSFRDSLNVIRDLQINGWKEVTAIKELTQQVANNTTELNRISGSIADSNSMIAASTKETSKSLKGRLEVKVVGTTP